MRWAQTRGRRGRCRLARTAWPMAPARSSALVTMLQAWVTVAQAVSAGGLGAGPVEVGAWHGGHGVGEDGPRA